MDIKRLQKNWDEFGKIDPLWAILTDPNKKGGKWKIDEFFQTGVKEIDAVMKYIDSLGVSIQRRRALDFGCGVGRLTQPLCQYFNEVYGSSETAAARHRNRCPIQHGDKCHYYLNETDDLKLFPNNYFDFIYTNITLQHMKPNISKNYIKEFLRILCPNGLLIFQLPSQLRVINLSTLILRICPKTLLDLTYRKVKYRNQPRMEMYRIKRKHVVRLLKLNGAKIVDIIEYQSAGTWWVSYRYCVTKE